MHLRLKYKKKKKRKKGRRKVKVHVLKVSLRVQLLAEKRVKPPGLIAHSFSDGERMCMATLELPSQVKALVRERSRYCWGHKRD